MGAPASSRSSESTNPAIEAALRTLEGISRRLETTEGMTNQIKAELFAEKAFVLIWNDMMMF